jgi:hypothetical protein
MLRKYGAKNNSGAKIVRFYLIGRIARFPVIFAAKLATFYAE